MRLPTPPIGVTSVETVTFYTDEARTVGAQAAPVALVGDQWLVDTLNVPAGRWWATVNAHKDAVPYAYPLPDPVDLPEDDRLILSPEALATKIGVALPLTTERRSTLRDAIVAAQADVCAYLGRDSLVPTQRTETGLWDAGPEWLLNCDEDVISIVSTIPEQDLGGAPTGTYTVIYLAGLDAANDPALEPIRRYVIAHAKNQPEVTDLWRVATNTKGRVKTLSAEGQSVTFETPSLGGGGKTGSGDPGSLPNIATLDRWRLAGRRVHQATTRYGTRYGTRYR